MEQLIPEQQKITEALFFGIDDDFCQNISAATAGLPIKVTCITSDRQQLKQSLQSDDVGILFIRSQDSQEIYDVLALKEAFRKDSQVIVSKDSVDYRFLKDACKDFDLFRLITYSDVNDKLLALISTAADLFQERKNSKNLFVKYHQKNKKWKDLTQQLALVEQEKSSFLNTAKTEERKKNQSEKKLKRFVTNLSYVSNVDDYVKSIFREIKKRAAVQGIYIFVEHRTLGQVLYTLQRGQLFSKRLVESIEELSLLDDNAVREFLANTLDRPFLFIEKQTLEFQNKRKGFILFELVGRSSLDEMFFTFWHQVRQAVAMILDRLLLRIEMESARGLWEKTFESLKAPMVILDKDGKIIKMNQAFLRIQSYDLMLFLIENHKNGVKSPLEWKTHQQDFQLLAYPILFEQSAMESTMYYFQDQKQMQDSYSKKVQTEKMAAIGLLAGNIAHELNNPFAGLKSVTQLLLSEAGYEPYKEDLQEILNGVDRCLSTIQNLQNYTSENDELKQDIMVVDLVDKTLPLLKAALRQYNVTIERLQNPKVHGNFHLLQQVVFNLIHNACQAMGDQGHLQIIIKEDKNMAYIMIKDSGRGISEEHLSSVFDPFFTTKEIGEGTGLGLSICKKIIENHLGRIEIASKKNAGAVFTISLPRVDL